MEAGRKRYVSERIVRSAREIRNADRFAFLGREPQDAFVELDRNGADGILRRLLDPVRLSELEHAARGVVAVDGAAVRLGELDRARDDRRQHELGIEARRDRAADLLERLQFENRLSQVARAFLDLLLERAVGLLQ